MTFNLFTLSCELEWPTLNGCRPHHWKLWWRHPHASQLGRCSHQILASFFFEFLENLHRTCWFFVKPEDECCGEDEQRSPSDDSSARLAVAAAPPGHPESAEMLLTCPGLACSSSRTGPSAQPGALVVTLHVHVSIKNPH